MKGTGKRNEAQHAGLTSAALDDADLPLADLRQDRQRLLGESSALPRTPDVASEASKARVRPVAWAVLCHSCCSSLASGAALGIAAGHCRPGGAVRRPDPSPNRLTRCQREVMRATPPQAARPSYSAASAFSTLSSWVLGVTFGKALATLPSGPMMNVARWMPMYFLPYIDFSTQVP